ncbi:MAG: DUF4382 domain-containing protein [Bacteroidales bacterium]|nr:DUF4382 domain-containing protein [Bacteroidales bacterium]MDT8433019.1 DUF4382 domain-containing protein [Bacteroidales bacterium]
MYRRIIAFASVAIVLNFLSLGCEKQEQEDVSDFPGFSMQNGVLNIWATDAPFPVALIEKAMIKVVKMELRQEDDSVFRLFSQDTTTFDLLSLRNGVMESLASKEIVPGNYDQLRLYIDQASLVIKDGRTSTLKVPGGPQSGLKILFDPTIRIRPGMVANVMLDFDLSRSFIFTGNPKSTGDIRGFNFKPVIRTAVIDNTGIIAGKVTDLSGLAIADAAVWVTGDSVIASTFTDQNGAYAILGIPEGIFSVTSAVEGFVAREAGGIQIRPEEKTICDFQLSSTK